MLLHLHKQKIVASCLLAGTKEGISDYTKVVYMYYAKVFSIFTSKNVIFISFLSYAPHGDLVSPSLLSVYYSMKEKKKLRQTRTKELWQTYSTCKAHLLETILLSAFRNNVLSCNLIVFDCILF